MLQESARVLAFAKVNLTLEILTRREDGYHNLRSIMLPIGLADEIAIERSERFSFVCDPAELASDNLVVKAIERLGLRDAPFAVQLRKQIPVGAGLGGGSSDAAAMLLAAMRGEFGPLPDRDWIADARALGSDVPFFLVESGALVEGTGERVTALGALPPWWVVLVMPDTFVPTGAAYAALATARHASPPATRPRSESASVRALVAVQRADFDAAIAAATNDFEPIVRANYPAVGAVLDALRAAHAELAMLSGSGGACFALARDESRARELVARLTLPPGARLFAVPLGTAAAWRAASSA